MGCVLVEQRLPAHPALFACLYSPNKLDTLIETLFGTTSFITIITLNCSTKKTTKQKIDYVLHNLLVIQLHLGRD